MKEVLKFLRSFFNKQEFAAKDGKLQLTDEQTTRLADAGITADKLEKLLATGAKELDLEEAQAAAKLEVTAANADAQAKSDLLASEKAEKEKLQKQIEDLKAANQLLADIPEPQTPLTVVSNNKATHNGWMFGSHTGTHFMGMNHDFYSRAKWYNNTALELGKGHKPELMGEKLDQDPAFLAELKADFKKYALDLSARYRTLKSKNHLPALRTAMKNFKQDGDVQKFAAAGDIDFSDLDSNLGAYYYIRRQDALIAYIESLPNIETIFPARYGIADGEVLIDAFTGRSTTQAYKTGRVFKGEVKMQDNIAKVKDVMFKYIFKDLKDLEAQYSYYLWDDDGSSPIKFSFIEWVIARSTENLMNEKNERAVIGTRVDPNAVAGESAHHLYASDGVLTTMDILKTENRVYIDTSKNDYDETTILDYVENFVRNVWRAIGVQSLQGWALYMNANDIPDFLNAYNEKYGDNTDYVGDMLMVRNFNVSVIIGVPNMGTNRYDMWITPINNFRTLRNFAGEELQYYFEREFEEMYAMSYWKEGTRPVKPGLKYASQAALVSGVKATRGKNTTIWANDPFTELAVDATTADTEVNVKFRSIANTGATALTDFENATEGVLYTLECGDLTNATTVAQALKFANITAAWTPTAVGDYLRVIYDPVADEFLEYDRKVGGTVTVNNALVTPAYVDKI